MPPWFEQFVSSVPWSEYGPLALSVAVGLVIGWFARLRPKREHVTEDDVTYRVELNNNYEILETSPPSEPMEIPSLSAFEEAPQVKPKVITRRSQLRDEWREQIRASKKPSAYFSHEFEGAFSVAGYRKKGLGSGKQRLEIDGDVLYFNGIQEHVAPHTVRQIKAHLLSERAKLEETT